MSDPRDSDARVAAAAGPATEHAPTGLGHEPRDIRARPILLAFVALGITALLVQGLMYVVLARFTANDMRVSEPASPLAATYGMKAPPEPRLQVAPRDDLAGLHAREDALLHGYAWVDRQAGVARIPIDRAIEILAAGGGKGAAGADAAAGAVGADAAGGAGADEGGRR